MWSLIKYFSQQNFYQDNTSPHTCSGINKYGTYSRDRLVWRNTGCSGCRLLQEHHYLIPDSGLARAIFKFLLPTPSYLHCPIPAAGAAHFAPPASRPALFSQIGVSPHSAQLSHQSPRGVVFPFIIRSLPRCRTRGKDCS